jgi:hypothetical protein
LRTAISRNGISAGPITVGKKCRGRPDLRRAIIAGRPAGISAELDGRGNSSRIRLSLYVEFANRHNWKRDQRRPNRRRPSDRGRTDLRRAIIADRLASVAAGPRRERQDLANAFATRLVFANRHITKGDQRRPNRRRPSDRGRTDLRPAIIADRLASVAAGPRREI